jgi:hypothetical protein
MSAFLINNSDLLGGIAIAFALAFVAIAFDIQDAIKSRLGDGANTSVLTVRQGWLVLVGWSLFDVALYMAALSHPTWARQTFGFDIANNKLAAGVVVGLSAVIVIRSKLAKVSNVELGFEWAYLWSRAYALTSVNRARFQARVQCEGKYFPFALDTTNYPTLFSSLERWLRVRAEDLEQGACLKVKNQIDEIRKRTAAPDHDPDARKYLFGVAFDYLSPREIKDWGDTVPLVKRTSVR